MSDTSRADRFASALQGFEKSGDGTDLHEQFTESPTLVRAELPDHGGSSNNTDDAAAFWAAYRDQFSEIRTEFTHITETGDLAVLEWESTGTLSTDRPITYRGVSILEYDQDSVARFATYYDTAAFLLPS